MTFRTSGLDVSRETSERLAIYFDLLLQWNKRINLIGRGTIADIRDRHMADSLQLRPFLRAREEAVDLGSGAGFPGVVIAMMLAEQGGGSVTMIEATAKKCAFLREVVRQTDLNSTDFSVTILNGRIEQAFLNARVATLITARALASLDMLFEMCADAITGETRALFHKGERFQEEISAAQKRWRFEHEAHRSAVNQQSVILEITQLRRRSMDEQAT
ncbi:MAG: 16S rRNA (guanine(527)-N(7))-methyltransferase RsmG [Ahrensia sp.]|nr:16S rRNA (guanine(527)-N(7))-methyltransferase RsmG [Ahrensia sp.]